MDQVWEQLVQNSLADAINKYGEAPISGSRFSQAIKRHAQQAGLEFPPTPFKTFGEFIEQFSSIVIPHYRPGRDMLLAPFDKPELLLLERQDSSINRIRDDFFNAFTKIPKNSNEGEPYYLVPSDEIAWFTNETPKPGGAIPLPPATFEREISDRKNFIESTAEMPHEVKTKLSLALEDTSPLGSFSNAVKNVDLAPAWHQFRTVAIVKRLRSWSSEHGIPWRSSWIAETRLTAAELPAAEQVAALPEKNSAALAGFLATLASTLTDEDMARISIPMDIIAKAWRGKRD